MDAGSRGNRGRRGTRPDLAGETRGTRAGTDRRDRDAVDDRGRDATDDRGQTAVIAVVLLVGLVAVASIGILLIGAQANDEGRQQAETERIEQAFLELDSEVDSVARSESDERTVDLDLPPGSDAAVREEVAGRLWINRTNFTTRKTVTLVDRSIGAIRYTRDDGTTFAFQAGGVWMEEGRTTRMLSPPAFSYDLTRGGNNPTLTVPIVTTSGDTRLEGGEVRVRKKATIAPLNDESIVENDLVSMRVQSRWYVGWADFFRQLTRQGAVTVDHANNTATVEMVVPAVSPSVNSGLVAGAANGELKLKQDTVVDSYNSSKNSYAATADRDEGKVAVINDVQMQQNSEIRGDLEVGGDVRFETGSTSEVTGNLSHVPSTSFTKDDPKDGPPHVAGWVAPNASVRPRTQVDGFIDLHVGALADPGNNDNASTAVVSGGTLGSCSPCELENGSYYFDELTVGDGETLVLNTSDGMIELAVNGTMSLEGTGSIEVQGDNRVNVYVNAEGAGATSEFEMSDDAKITVEGDRAPLFWLYMDSNSDVVIQQGATFTGVIYGPSKGGGGARINLDQNVEVYGAVLGNVKQMGQNVSVHYDRALRNSVPVTTNIAVPKLTFLHVAVYEVEVEDD